MKKFVLAILCTAFPHLSSAQVEDGIYVIPELDAYSVILTNNNVVQGYLFSLSGSWNEIRGSRINEVIELVEVRDDEIVAIKVTGGLLGANIVDLFCSPYPADGGGCQNTAENLRALPVLKATGSLKAIYKTQFGADLVVFESDGIAVILSFEYGDSTAVSDQNWIGAYTANISDDLAIFNIEAVVESDDSEDEVVIRFDAQISDLANPQAEFKNFQCEVKDGETLSENCDEIQKKYFSKLIRIF